MQLQTMDYWSRKAQKLRFNYQWLKPVIIGLISINLVASHPLHSADQFTTAQCAQLSQALDDNRDEQRTGYALRDSERIKDEELQFEKQIRTYCESPVSVEVMPMPNGKFGRRSAHRTPSVDTSTKRGNPLLAELKKAREKAAKLAEKNQGKVAAGSDRAGLRGTLSPQAQHRHFLASLVELRTPYNGAQQQAWLAWYQEPYWCYGVKMTKQIVACVNKRQKAQEQFEDWWQRQNLSDQ
jgi:hypothetical protein